MRVLVTGATGFLGKALCARLEEQGHSLTRLNSRNCDLTRQDSLNSYTDAYDQIYHLAAWTQAGDFCLYHAGQQWIINQQINTNVLAWWHSQQPQAKLISIGTSCAYDPQLELEEENYLSGKPVDSLFTYAMTKRMLYSGLLALDKQFNLNYLHLVPSTLYGPGYHTDGRQMHFIFDLIRKIIRGKIYGEPVVLWGDGEQRRELVHVDDFVQIMLQLSQSVQNEIINIGAGEECTIRHFADLICSQIGYDSNAIQYDVSRYIGAKSKCLSVGKLENFIANPALRPLEEGLHTTVDWFWSERDRLI